MKLPVRSLMKSLNLSYVKDFAAHEKAEVIYIYAL